MYRGWTQTDYQNKHYNINQKDEGTQDDRGRDGGTNFILRIKEQERRLTLHEHDDNDDDDDDYDIINRCQMCHTSDRSLGLVLKIPIGRPMNTSSILDRDRNVSLQQWHSNRYTNFLYNNTANVTITITQRYKQCTYNLTLRHFRATIVAVEKQ